MANDKLGLGLRIVTMNDYYAWLAQIELYSKFDLRKLTVSWLLKKYHPTENAIVGHKGRRCRSTSVRKESQIVRSVKKDPFKSTSVIPTTSDWPYGKKAPREGQAVLA